MELTETETPIPGLKIIQPKVFGDARGFFLETYSSERYRNIGLPENFVQDNLSYSSQGILRGLHFQNPGAQGKLVTVLQGEVFDVAVDVRWGSPTFGRWYGIYLSADSKKQFWIPAGFAHGFVVTSDSALFSYKCDEYYQPQSEFSLLWNDPDLGIEWPVKAPTLSEKDKKARRLKDLHESELPRFIQ
jgi:dTDP-4-dehydrorhamnose 3,5-epimerase